MGKDWAANEPSRFPQLDPRFRKVSTGMSGNRLSRTRILRMLVVRFDTDQLGGRLQASPASAGARGGAHTQAPRQRTAGKHPQRTEGSLAANSNPQRQGFQRSQRFLDRATIPFSPRTHWQRLTSERELGQTKEVLWAAIGFASLVLTAGPRAPQFIAER